jgi:deoxyribodipyrimidine photo-lyase
MTKYGTTLYIFRRDLRVYDNTAFNEANRLSNNVIPCFIFDPRQIEPHAYQSKPGLHFMLQSIVDLEAQLKNVGGRLALFHSNPHAVIAQLSAQHQIEAVFINRDYTPFSKLRDTEIADVCLELGITLHILPDVLLIEPEHALKSDSTPYKVFTAFYNFARQIPVILPQASEKACFVKVTPDLSVGQLKCPSNETIKPMPGGRGKALALLENIGNYQNYAQGRDSPYLVDATSRLSAHLKFGTCSIREAYYAIVDQLGTEHPLLRQLYWRDFFTHIGFHFPRVFGHAFKQKYGRLKWGNNTNHFQAWCKGETGFPIVDAGMRELNATGFMHNRVRMVAASFLVKDLHIDWRWGERYFAQHLVDYDPCVNNGNWQWVASTGCDAQPYFRIFNPWKQQQKFDPDCGYIFRWIPELKAFPVNMIHHWDKKHIECSYPRPIIDHSQESRITKERYKESV